MNEGLLSHLKPLERGSSMNTLSQKVSDSLNLEDQPLFSPIKVEDFCLTNPHRSRDITRLRFPFPVGLFTVKLGGSHPTYFYIWKLDPSLSSEENYQKSEVLSSKCRSEIVKPLTRIEMSELRTRTSRLTNWDRQLVYHGFDLGSGRTGSESVLSKSKQKEMEYLLDTGEYESIGKDMYTDLETPSNFEPFWTSLEEVIHDYTVLAEERRRDSYGYVPLCFSIPNLVEKVCEKYKDTHDGQSLPKEQIPHVQTVRTSFEPLKMTNATSHFKGRFNVKRLSQRRDLRQHNNHSYYANKLWKKIEDY